MSGWREKAAKYHNDLKQTMIRYRGKILQTSHIREIIEQHPVLAKDSQFVYPSDHCINHTNKGACYCALTEEAIFEQIRHGIYRVRKT
ncbi:MAG: hypothetical protein JW976_07145 [Syntrophaceae bacterium]|nr:hypothetical protein [Syntrophaceae bacterium]